METPEKAPEFKKEKILQRTAQHREAPNPALSQKRQREIVAYVGPHRPFGLPLMQNAVLHKGAMPQVEEKIAEHEAFGTLFVPLTELAHARVDLRQEGSVLYAAYQKVIQASQPVKGV